MHLGYTFTCPLVFFKTSLMLTWLIHTWIKHTHIIWFFLPWERICHFKLCEQPKNIVFWVHQSKKVRPDFEKVTMKFWIPSSTWLPSTPKSTWLLSIHTEKTRYIVFYTRQPESPCVPYAPRRRGYTCKVLAVWTLSAETPFPRKWIFRAPMNTLAPLAVLSSNFCNEDFRQNLHSMSSSAFLQEVLLMTPAQKYNIYTKQRSILNWRQLSRPADAPSWDSNPVLVAGKCHVCINPEQETKISLFKLVFTWYDAYLIWQSVEDFCDGQNRNSGNYALPRQRDKLEARLLLGMVPLLHNWNKPTLLHRLRLFHIQISLVLILTNFWWWGQWRHLIPPIQWRPGGQGQLLRIGTLWQPRILWWGSPWAWWDQGTNRAAFGTKTWTWDLHERDRLDADPGGSRMAVRRCRRLWRPVQLERPGVGGGGGEVFQGERWPWQCCRCLLWRRRAGRQRLESALASTKREEAKGYKKFLQWHCHSHVWKCDFMIYSHCHLGTSTL